MLSGVVGGVGVDVGVVGEHVDGGRAAVLVDGGGVIYTLSAIVDGVDDDRGGDGA